MEPGESCGKGLEKLANASPRKGEGAGEQPVSLAELRGNGWEGYLVLQSWLPCTTAL